MNTALSNPSVECDSSAGTTNWSHSVCAKIINLSLPTERKNIYPFRLTAESYACNFLHDLRDQYIIMKLIYLSVFFIVILCHPIWKKLTTQGLSGLNTTESEEKTSWNKVG